MELVERLVLCQFFLSYTLGKMSDFDFEGDFEGEFEEEPEQIEGRVGKSGSARKKCKVESAVWVDPTYAAQSKIT